MRKSLFILFLGALLVASCSDSGQRFHLFMSHGNLLVVDGEKGVVFEPICPSGECVFKPLYFLGPNNERFFLAKDAVGAWALVKKGSKWSASH